MPFSNLLNLVWKEQGRLSKREPRYPDPGISVCYWDGGVPVARQLKNISVKGAYLYTPDRWYIGTIMKLALQKKSESAESYNESALQVSGKVIRHGPDGLGVRFILQSDADRKSIERFIKRATDDRNSRRETRHADSGTHGQALIEFALVLPILFLLVFNTVNFCAFLYAFITVTDAARAGAQYAALGAQSANNPPEASVSNVTNLVLTATSLLPNSGSVTVAVCQNDNGTLTQLRSTSACLSGFTQPPADTEPVAGTINFANVSVDVKYTYLPLVNLPTIAGWPLTLPPSTIHKSCVMRILN